MGLKLWDNDDNILTAKDINSTDEIIAIFQVNGLKFSSSSFQLDISLKQLMKFKKEIFSKCLIKINNNVDKTMTNIYSNLSNFSDSDNLEKKTKAGNKDSEEDSEEDSQED